MSAAAKFFLPFFRAYGDGVSLMMRLNRRVGYIRDNGEWCDLQKRRRVCRGAESGPLVWRASYSNKAGGQPMTTLTCTVEPAGTGERMLPLTGLPSTVMVLTPFSRWSGFSTTIS